jgi:hypothetical protein
MNEDDDFGLKRHGGRDHRPRLSGERAGRR